MSTQVLREYGLAMRRDWSHVDGRAVYADLMAAADVLDGAPVSTEGLRHRLGLCAEGGGHWMDDLCDRCGKEDDQ